MEKFTLEAENIENPVRVDRFISENSKVSRTRLKADNCIILINGRPAKLSKSVVSGDIVEVTLPDEEKPQDIVPEKMELDIIFEDENVIVINKAQGVVVHPAAGNFGGTLVNGLLHHAAELEEEFEDENVRPGIVHRLDKDTSGVIIVAKNPETHEFLSEQFRNKVTRKTYLAVIKGCLPRRHDIIETYIVRDRQNRKKFTVPGVGSEKGRFAATEYEVAEEFDRYTFCRLYPHTGRTHQLRVHMQYLNVPILGDPVYSRKDGNFPEATLMLHAASLEIFIPGREEKQLFTAPVPERFENILKELRNGK